MIYSNITSVIENNIRDILSDTIFTEEQRRAFAYGSYLAWHALIEGEFKPEDDYKLWRLTQSYHDWDS
ncbi:TPA: hypothetical protein H2V50_004434 [Salmonella enterica]|nr:hypothetical protein [Salmonella enterica]